MSDYYTQTSFVIEDLSTAEKAWLGTTIDGIRAGQAPDRLSPLDAEFFEFQGDDLWVHADDIDIEAITSFVQEFMATWRERQVFCFSYANTCSKPVVDAFSGGAVIITASSVQHFNASAQAEAFAQRLRHDLADAEIHSVINLLEWGLSSGDKLAGAVKDAMTALRSICIVKDGGYEAEH